MDRGTKEFLSLFVTKHTPPAVEDAIKHFHIGFIFPNWRLLPG